MRCTKLFEAKYSTVSFTSVVCFDNELVRLSLTSQGCQFNVHFIQCETSADILEIVNEFDFTNHNYHTVADIA